MNAIEDENSKVVVVAVERNVNVDISVTERNRMLWRIKGLKHKIIHQSTCR